MSSDELTFTYLDNQPSEEARAILTRITETPTPLNVLIFGGPGAGKSTLMNR